MPGAFPKCTHASSLSGGRHLASAFPARSVCSQESTPGLLSPALSPWLFFLYRVWYWGYISFYDTGGYIQELGASLEESRAQLRYLQQHTWIDNM